MEIGAEIIASIEERDLLSEHFDILGNIKTLSLLPGTECMTTAQVADFYKVGLEAIKSLTKDHRAELNADGVYLASRGEILNFLKGPVKTVPGKTIITSEVNGKEYEFSNRGILLYPRRAVLKIGMLLRDSEIAKEVREQLINIGNKTGYEQRLMMNIGKAFASGNVIEVIKAIAKYRAFQNAK